MRTIITFHFLFLTSFLFSQRLARTAPSDLQNDDEFGWEVAIDGNIAVVGAPSVGDSGGKLTSNPGKAYIYEYNPSDLEWTLQQTLEPQIGAGANTHFGYAVAIADSVIVIGAYGDENLLTQPNHGLVYVFEPDEEGDWVQTIILNGKDPVTGGNSRESGAHFGRSVDTDGQSIIVGEPQRSSNAGRWHLFEKDSNGSSWIIVAGGNGSGSERLGDRVVVDGDYAAIAAPGANINQGAVEIYKRDSNGDWNLDETIGGTIEAVGVNNYSFFGQNIALDDEQLAITESGKTVAPRARYYQLENDTWTFKSQIEYPEAILSSSFSPLDVAVRGENMIVGARRATFESSSTGSAKLFALDTTTQTWTETFEFSGESTSTDSYFGGSVDIIDQCQYMVGVQQPFGSSANSSRKGGVFFKRDFIDGIATLPGPLPYNLRIENLQLLCCSDHNENAIQVFTKGDPLIEAAKQQMLQEPENFYRLEREYTERPSRLRISDPFTLISTEYFQADGSNIFATKLNMNDSLENNGVVLEIEVEEVPVSSNLNGANPVYTVLVPILITGFEVEAKGRTTLPQMPYMILHDPPGDGSFSEFTAGKETCRKLGASVGVSSSISGWQETKLGASYGADYGPVSVGHETSASSKVTVEAGFEVNLQSQVEQCFSVSETIRTSELNPEFDSIGLGDVYIGYGTDLIYGVYREILVDQKECAVSSTSQLIVRPVEDQITEFTFTEAGILGDIERLENLIAQPTTSDSLKFIFRNQILVWENVIARNKTNIANAFLTSSVDTIQAISGTLAREYEKVVTTNKETSFEFSMFVSLEVQKEIGAKTEAELAGNGGSVETSAGVAIKARSDFGASVNVSSTNTEITKYKLFDDDSGDLFYIGIKEDEMFGTPVFRLEEGSLTSCPYEGQIARDQPRLEGKEEGSSELFQQNIVIKDAIVGQVAAVELNICNDADADPSRSYFVKLDNTSNPENARLILAGENLNSSTDGKDYIIARTDCVNGSPKLDILQALGAPDRLVYENLQIYMYPECEEGLQSRINVSVYFGNSFDQCTGDDLMLSDTIFNDELERGSNTIQSTSIIEATANAIYSAAQSITLRPGFQARNGAQFTASVEPCDPVPESAGGDARISTPPQESKLVISPNPLSQEARIQFYVAEASEETQLSVRNMNGQLVRHHIFQSFDQGWQEWLLQAHELPTGMYFVTLQTPSSLTTKKIMIAK